jgi:hypothetical protein
MSGDIGGDLEVTLVPGLSPFRDSFEPIDDGELNSFEALIGKSKTGLLCRIW